MSEYEPYSPQLRTALVLTGTGTAGAYHAGVLRALHEAGVKIDVVAGRGVGVVGALFAAVDGAQRLWDDKGFWRSPAVSHLYPWRRPARLVGLALAIAFAIVAVPLGAMAAGLVVFPVDFLFKLVGAGDRVDLAGAYLRLAERVFAADGLPTWLPRAVFLVLGSVAVFVAIDGWKRSARQGRGSRWWRLLPSPLDQQPMVDYCWRTMWDLIRGAARLRQPTAEDLSRRYTEMLTENLGQPRFRELVLVAHDMDSHRDVVAALVT